jgi:hypothetical protein
VFRQPELFASLGLAAGLLMTRVGVAKKLLVERRADRLCPSCGRLYNGRVCRRCTG